MFQVNKFKLYVDIRFKAWQTFLNYIFETRDILVKFCYENCCRRKDLAPIEALF